MMEIVELEILNEVYYRVKCDRSIAVEISERFVFDVPNAKHTPKYKSGIWDGKIRLFNIMTRLLPRGLRSDLIKFCNDRDYKIIEPKEDKFKISPQALVEYTTSLSLVKNDGSSIDVHDYQYSAIYKSLNSGRKTIISPTGSGKSMIAYLLCRAQIDMIEDSKILVIVPTLQLVSQMKGDFSAYSKVNGWSSDDNIHLIPIDKGKMTNKKIVVSTWQSLQNIEAAWFYQFTSVIVDEVQSAKSQSIQKILSNCVAAKFRYGLTGSLDRCETNEMMIRGMLGDIVKVASTVELQERGILSDLDIKCIVLNYDAETKKQFRECTVINGKKRYSRVTYDTEIKLIVSNSRRNNFISKLAASTHGNTLVLFNYVESHGIPLHQSIKDAVDGKRLVLIAHGKTGLDERELIGVAMRKEGNVIAVASYGTFQAGINIPEIDNIILASPTKSVVRLLQSIGRGLRKSNNKDICLLFDICDNAGTESRHNHTYDHFIERLSIYINEGFNYEIKEIQF